MHQFLILIEKLEQPSYLELPGYNPVGTLKQISSICGTVLEQDLRHCDSTKHHLRGFIGDEVLEHSMT